MGKPDETPTPRTKKEFFDKVVAELNLDVRDPFTLLLANACALVDLRESLERELAEWSSNYAGWCVKMVHLGVTSFGTLDEAIDKLASNRTGGNDQSSQDTPEN